MGSFADRNPAGGNAAGLLILTGASHTGKTSVAKALLQQTPPPAAYLSVDEILRTVLVRTPGDIWEQIPLAYELMRQQAETLVGDGWLVLLESTFTYVPVTGEPEFHLDELERLIGIAERNRVPLTVAQLGAPVEQLVDRANKTGRLKSDIVARTAELHETVTLPDFTLRLDSSVDTSAKLASRLLTALKAPH